MTVSHINQGFQSLDVNLRRKFFYGTNITINSSPSNNYLQKCNNILYFLIADIDYNIGTMPLLLFFWYFEFIEILFFDYFCPSLVRKGILTKIKTMKKYFILIALLLCYISSYSSDYLAEDVGPPQTGKKALVRFAYLADLHVSDVATNVEDLETSVKDINNLKGIDFVILAGDITEFGSDEEILLAKSIVDKLTIPYYIVAGNHDSKWSESGCNTFSKVFGYEHFNFNFNGIQFIGTNSGPNMRMAPALVPRETIVWLDSVTNALPKHIPVVFINHYPLDDAMLNYKTVIDMLKRVNTQVSMCGHGHSNRVMDFEGIPGIMGRSNLRGNYTAAKPTHPGYNIVTITTDSITYAVRSNSITHKPWHKQPIKKESPPAMWGPSGKDRVDSPASAVWVYQDDSDIGSAAAFAFNMVFISNTAGVVKALDAADGSVKWSFKTDGKIFSSPEVCEKTGLLVVGSSDNHIYCLNAKTGKLKWKVEATKSVLGSPTIHKGIVYIGASDNAFRAIELSSGHLLWVYSQIKGFIEAKPWADDQGVYIGDWANKVYAFNPADGRLLWKWTNNKGRGLSAAAVWPLKANGKLFVVTPERRSHAIDAKTGKELWSARGGRESIGLSPDGNTLYVKTMQDTVLAFSTKDFTPAAASSPAASSPAATSPAAANPATVATPKSGPATAATTATKPAAAATSPAASQVGKPHLLWASHTGYGYEIAPSPITTANDLVFIPTDKGNIFVLNAADGTVAWTYRFSIALINYIRPIGNRTLLVTSMDGKVGLIKY